jgi:hypothetical protein
VLHLGVVADLPSLWAGHDAARLRSGGMVALPILWNQRPIDIAKARTLLARLQDVQPLPEIRDEVDRTTRLQVLATVVEMWRHRQAGRTLEWLGSFKVPAPPAVVDLPLDAVDWNEALRLVNIGIDDAVARLSNPALPETPDNHGPFSFINPGLKAFLARGGYTDSTRKSVAHAVASYALDHYLHGLEVLTSARDAGAARHRLAVLHLAILVDQQLRGHLPDSLDAIDVKLEPYFRVHQADGYEFEYLPGQEGGFAIRSRPLRLKPTDGSPADRVNGDCVEDTGRWWSNQWTNGCCGGPPYAQELEPWFHQEDGIRYAPSQEKSMCAPAKPIKRCC